MRRCTRQVVCLHKVRSRAAPSYSLLPPRATPSSHLGSHRTLHDLTRPPVISEDPCITSKLAAVDQTNPLSLVETACTTLASDAQSEEVLSTLVGLLPELDGDSVWLPVVVWAVGVRAAHCLYSRVITSRSLEKSLPHSDWYYRKQIELAFWRDTRNFERVGDIGLAVDQYSSDNKLVGGPHSVRKRAARSAAVLAYANICGLYFFSQVYALQLEQGPFLWLPSLLQHDPLYILPATNLVLSVALFKLVRQGILYPSKMPKSRVPPSIRQLFGDRPVSAVVFLSISAVLGGKLFIVSADLIPSLYLLFWTSSNITALLITLTLMKSDVARKQMNLLPRQEFKLLLAKQDIALDPELMDAEKRKMNEFQEQMIDQSKESSPG